MSRVDYFFGEIDGYPLGSTFKDRKEVMRAGLHDNWVPGISGTPEKGADCIALNRGYIDDEDHGDWILYTGAGGNDPSTKRQVADQDINHHHNAALVYSEENGLPVRVVRGPKGEKPYAPSAGYRYDGLYKVVRHWAELGRDGFRIWRFHLVRLTPDEALPWTPKAQNDDVGSVAGASDRRIDTGQANVDLDLSSTELMDRGPEGNTDPARTMGVVQRIVRSTKVSQYIKELYEHRCQVCRVELDLPVGHYSEGAHIRPLGAPGHGPDTVDNLICLCPNHHVLFDQGGIYFDDDLTVRDHRGNPIGQLDLKAGHTVNVEHIRFHRHHHAFS